MKIKVITLGCKVNIYESEYIHSKVKKSNYELVTDNSVADIYIINTCTVTNSADVKSRKTISACVKENKNAIIAVVGCYSQYRFHELKEHPNVKVILGNSGKSRIINYIDRYLETKNQMVYITSIKDQPFESFCTPNFETHTRAFVKIQDGCDSYCSYCIIPSVRGGVRSKEENVVIEEVKRLIVRGYKEFVLVGIHTGKYGKDIDSSLYTLISKLMKLEGIKRIRISSIEVNEVHKIIALMYEDKVVVDHLHIPLQSGTDKILKLMNRKYNTSEYKKEIEYIKQFIPNVSITTDVIVGFPHETDEDFKETLNFIEKLGITSIHAFPYSPRLNTPAATMDNQVDGLVKKQRVKQTLELSKKLEEKFIRSFIGEELEVLIDTIEDKYVYGYTTNYIRIKIKKDDNYLKNDLCLVKITKYENGITTGVVKQTVNV